jgi:hypothetical protein
MSTTVFKSFWTVAICLGAMISLTDVACANAIAVPGPIAGVGLSVWAVVGASYWLMRKLRNRSRF